MSGSPASGGRVVLPADGGLVAERALTWVEGPDAASFLQGLLSNDIQSLAPGADRHALLLDAKGHIVVALTVRRDADDAFTLITEPHLGAPLSDALARYHFSEDLEVLGPEPAAALVVPTGVPDPADADLVVDGWVPGTREAVIPDPGAVLASRGLRPIPADALERARIAAGRVRVGIDTGPTTLVQEAGLEDAAVSFDKGCYLGQETVARAQFRGRVNRVPRVLRIEGAPPELPAPVFADDRAVGQLTSIAPDAEGHIGLAIMRREIAPGSRVTVGAADGPAALVMAVPGRDGAPEAA